jgi:hypothetical protein
VFFLEGKRYKKLESGMLKGLIALIACNDWVEILSDEEKTFLFFNYNNYRLQVVQMKILKIDEKGGTKCMYVAEITCFECNKTYIAYGEFGVMDRYRDPPRCPYCYPDSKP